MKKIILALTLSALVTGCGAIETNHVGVRTSWQNIVQMEEVNPGFYTSVISNVKEFSTREITVDLLNMTPKAGDNLSLADMDLEVYYTPNKTQIAELHVKYANRHAKEKGHPTYPAYMLVQSFAREATYRIVAQYDSLQIHKHRDAVGAAIFDALSKRLEETDPGAFTINKVIVRNLKTDPSVENAIMLAVAKNKELEAKKIEVDIAEQQALAYANLNKQLTPAILRKQELDVAQAAVDNGATVTLLVGSDRAMPFYNVQK